MKKTSTKKDFDHYIDEYLYYCQSRRLRQKTMQSYEQSLRLFERWALEQENVSSPDEVREATIRHYICDLQERGKYSFYADESRIALNCPERRRDYRQPVSITTINNYIRNLRAFFNWYYDELPPQKNPMRKIKQIKCERKNREYLEDGELHRLLDCLDKSYFAEHRDSTVILLILDSGMRLGECLKLTVDHIDLTERVITIPAELTKGRKERSVYFSIKTARAIQRWLRFKDRYVETTSLFPVKATGFPVEVSTFETNFRNYVSRSGIQKQVSPHCLRNNFAKRYPIGDRTWTENAMQDYDGTITWVGVKFETPTSDFEYLVRNDEVDIICYIGTDTDVVIPSHIEGYPVTSIGEEAFTSCTDITSIKLPDGLASIGDYAFGACHSLTSIEIPNGVTSIGEQGFAHCYSLTSIEIPDTIINIGNHAFFLCENLTSIEFEGNAPRFGTDAFLEVTATCYYPVDDETWTEEVMQNYGGNLTWVCAACADGHRWAMASCTDPKTCTTCGETEGSALGHSYDDVITTPPTCTAQGYTTYTCTACGDSYVDSYLDALGHIWADADCMTPKTCSVCHATEGEARGHSFDSVVTLPTCTEQGCTTHTCAACGDSYVDSYVAALGHSFGDWYVTDAANCTEDGEQRRDCERCDAYETKTVPAVGHSYTSVVTAPTCTAQGYTTHTCAACGDNYVDAYVDALGHIWADADCTSPKTCSVCGETTGDALGHSYGSVVTVPTCTAQGYTTHTCSACGDSYVDSYVNALGHSFGDWYVTDAANCTEKGEQRRDCERCDAYETKTVPAMGHSYTAVVTAPTCTAAGFTTHTCECGSSYVDSYVNALGHSHTAVVTAPTCTEQGYTTYTCTCGDSYADDYVEALGHSWNNAPCTTPKTCSVCGKTEGSALGHTFEPCRGYDPTCTEDGMVEYACIKCYDPTVTYQVTVPALGHDWSSEWSCDSDGHWCVCELCGVKQDAVAHIPNIDAATEETAKYCTVCGYVIQPKLESVEPTAKMQIIMESTQVKAGETVDVTIHIKDNPGIASIKLKLHYPEGWTVNEVVGWDNAGGVFMASQNLTANPLTLNWYNGIANHNGDGTFVTISFTVPEDAEAGAYAFTIEPIHESIYNIAEEDIEVTVVNGTVEVSDYLPGDINGDGRVNNKDATRLFQYLSDWDVEVVEAALDVNGDGKVNNKDATRLFQFLSDWDVEIF